MKKFCQYFSVGILLFLPLYYARFKILGLSTNPIEVAVVLLGILTLIATRKELIWPHFSLPIFLILLGAVAGLLMAVDKTVALGIIKGWIVVPIVFYWAISQLMDERLQSSLVWALVANMTVVSLYAIAQWFGWTVIFDYQGGDVAQYVIQGRAFGLYESPNFLAMYLVPVVLLAVGFFSSKHLKYQWYLLLALPITALMLSGSRAGFVSLCIALLFLLGLIGKQWFKKILPVIWTLELLAIFAALALSSRAVSDSQHLLIWRQAITIGSQHPLFGIGAGQFQHYFAQNYDGSVSYYDAIPYALHPHSIFLAFWLYTGLAGIAGFVWLLWSFFVRAFTVSNKMAPVAAAAMIAVLIHGLFDTTYFKNDLAIIFWLLIALASWNGQDKTHEDRA